MQAASVPTERETEPLSATSFGGSPKIPDEISSEGSISLPALIGHCEKVDASVSVESAFETFRQNSVEFLAVVDGKELVGMCSRHAINSLLGGRYGFSLWSRKPIVEHLVVQATRISVATAITEVLKQVSGREIDRFYDDILLVDEEGGLLGLISTDTLIKVQNALLLGNIRQLEKKEREIRRKNEQIESDLRMAMELQQAMMPKTEPHSLGVAGDTIRGPRFEHRYVAASLVGGDFFHILQLSDSVAGIFVCDVMGHGVRSALVTAMLRAFIESCQADAADPSLLMAHLNSEFTKILKQADTVLFATALYCVLDSEKCELRCSAAGHPCPIHVRTSAGTALPLNDVKGSAGPALGLFHTASYGNARFPLERGDWILLFTDGIEEATNDAGAQFGVDGLTEVIQAQIDHAPGEVLDRLLSKVDRFVGGSPLIDDVCLVAAELPI